MESDHVMVYDSDTRHPQIGPEKKKKTGWEPWDLWLAESGSFLQLFKVITACRQSGMVHSQLRMMIHELNFKILNPQKMFPQKESV